MKEIREIIRAFDAAATHNKNTALATVVHVEGSSYRRAGARMLVTEDGQLTGAISGGCLEGDALKKAQLVMSERKSRLITYDTTGGTGSSDLEISLGCNGIIHILIEPIDTDNPDNPIQLLKEFSSQRDPVVMVTLFSINDKAEEQPGTCLFVARNKKTRGNLSDKRLQNILITDAHEVLETRSSITKVYRNEDELTGFIELLEPTISLIVTGAGNDTIPLMHLSDILGWDMTIIDCRSKYLTEERFPGVNKIIASEPEDVMSRLSPDDRTAIILMTHNYNYDFGILRELFLLDLPYIGLLGPKKRYDRMVTDLQKEGIFLSDGQLQNMFGPVGLDIGAESPEEIALSVVAQIRTVFAGKSGTHLRDKMEPIHSRESEMIYR